MRPESRVLENGISKLGEVHIPQHLPASTHVKSCKSALLSRNNDKPMEAKCVLLDVIDGGLLWLPDDIA